MLRILEGASEISDAQTLLSKKMKEVWKSSDNRLVVWRPSSTSLNIRHDSKYWFGTQQLSNAPIPRYWNSFGIFQEKRNLEISVEINVPLKGISRSIAGFFARDQFGDIYLLHDGSVGGGRKGVNRDSFLSFSTPDLIPAVASDGSERLGVLVVALGSQNSKRQIENFLQSVIDFKSAVKRGEFGSREVKQRKHQYGKYFKEFSGLKIRAAQAEVEYVTRHGDIVEALRAWRPLAPGESETKSVLIDWGICENRKLTELYEVKTSCIRQALYAGLGQLVTHGSICKRILVLPERETIPDDILAATQALSIAIVRYRLSSKSARIIP